MDITAAHFENYDADTDANGEVVSLTLGRRAAVAETELEASEEVKRRLFAIEISGYVARCREGGIQPEGAHFAAAVQQQVNDWGRRNTEFYYAFELMKVLARLNKKTFKLDAPPIAGLAPLSVISYLRESTRCWLYGFHGASVALSRACLEEALKCRLDPQRGTLEILIELATKQGLLDACMMAVAKQVRKTGNQFLHGKSLNEEVTRETLDAVRSLVEQLFST